jgi:hypothetical protein
MLAALAVFAISAVASASASAARTEVCDHGTNPLEEAQLCIEGKEAGSPNTETIPFTSVKKAATTSKLKVTGGPNITCGKAKNGGNFVAEDSVNVKVTALTVEFSECKVTNAEAECTVVEPIVANGGGSGIKGEIPNSGTTPKQINFSPTTGTEFATVTVESKPGQVCGFEAVAKVTGKQKCELPTSTTETEATKHEVICKEAGSELKFAGKEAKFELTEEVELAGTEENKGKKFSIIKSA